MTQAQRDLAHALTIVYGSDQTIEAGCVLDQLEDLGWSLTTTRPPRPESSLFPAASTSRLPKRGVS